MKYIYLKIHRLYDIDNNVWIISYRIFRVFDIIDIKDR